MKTRMQSDGATADRTADVVHEDILDSLEV